MVPVVETVNKMKVHFLLQDSSWSLKIPNISLEGGKFQLHPLTSKGGWAEDWVIKLFNG